MINRTARAETFFLFLFLAAASAFGAGPDEIILNDGNTISGRITEESGTQYTIRTAQNMYLRIDKSQVRRVNIAPRESPRREIRLAPPASSTAPATILPSTAPAPTAAPPPPAVLSIPAEDRRVARRTKGKATIVETFVTEVAAVPAATFEAAQDALYKGRSPGRRIAGRAHEAGRFGWTANWTGDVEPGKEVRWKSLTVRSTMTVTLPRWVPSGETSESDRLQWNEWLKLFHEHQEGHIDLYLRSVSWFAEAASLLSAGDESALRTRTERLFQTMLDQAERRQDGYDRRESAPAAPVPTKK